MSTAHQEPIPMLSDWEKFDPTKQIEYRFLDLDRNEFCESEHELATRYRHTQHTSRVIPAALQHNQILIATGSREFTALEAITRCRKLTGMLPAED